MNYMFPEPNGSPPTGVSRWNNPSYLRRVLKALSAVGQTGRALRHLRERFSQYLPGDPANPTPVRVCIIQHRCVCALSSTSACVHYPAPVRVGIIEQRCMCALSSASACGHYLSPVRVCIHLHARECKFVFCMCLCGPVCMYVYVRGVCMCICICAWCVMYVCAWCVDLTCPPPRPPTSSLHHPHQLEVLTIISPPHHTHAPHSWNC